MRLETSIREWLGLKADRIRLVRESPTELVAEIEAISGRLARCGRCGQVVRRTKGRMRLRRWRDLRIRTLLNVHAILAPNYGVTIVEAFDSAVSKFTALRYVGQARRIAPGRIVAVGDDINDLEMVSGAGLGVAMAGGAARLCAVADHVARSGLADFIRELLAGRFDGAG